MKHLLLCLIMAWTASAQVYFIKYRLGDELGEEEQATLVNIGETPDMYCLSAPDTLYGYQGTSEVWLLKSNLTVQLVSFVPNATISPSGIEKLKDSINTMYEVQLAKVPKYGVSPSMYGAKWYGHIFKVITGTEVTCFYKPGSMIVTGVDYTGDPIQVPDRNQIKLVPVIDIKGYTIGSKITTEQISKLKLVSKGHEITYQMETTFGNKAGTLVVCTTPDGYIGTLTFELKQELTPEDIEVFSKAIVNRYELNNALILNTSSSYIGDVRFRIGTQHNTYPETIYFRIFSENVYDEYTERLESEEARFMNEKYQKESGAILDDM